MVVLLLLECAICTAVDLDLICRACGKENILVLLFDINVHSLNMRIRTEAHSGDKRPAAEQAAAPRPASFSASQGHTTKYM